MQAFPDSPSQDTNFTAKLRPHPEQGAANGGHSLGEDFFLASNANSQISPRPLSVQLGSAAEGGHRQSANDDVSARKIGVF